MSSDEEELFVHLSCDDSIVESDYSEDNSLNDGGIQPYNFEPYLSELDTSTSGTDSDTQDHGNTDIPADIQRLQNTEW